MAKPEQHSTSEGLISTSMNFTDLKRALAAAGVPKEVLFNANSKADLIAIAQSKGLLIAGAPASSSTSVASTLASNRLSRANQRGSSPQLQAVSLAHLEQEIKALQSESTQNKEEIKALRSENARKDQEIQALRRGAPAAKSPSPSQVPAAETPAEASPAASTEEAPAASTPKTPEAPDNDDAMDEDDALLQEALAMSMKEDEGATVEPAAMEDDDEEEMKLALAMSMQQSEAPAPAAAGEFNDPAFVNSMLAQLPGVDPNDPAIQAALASINQGGEKKDDDAPAPAPAP